MRRAGTGLLLALGIALAACGGDDGEPGGPDAANGPGADADPAAPDAAPGTPDGAPGTCRARDLDPSWLKEYEQEVVAKLAGAMPIAPGLTLADRAKPENREATRIYLLAELTAMGYTPERHVYESGQNVFARLGTGAPGRPVVVLGAHYDGIPNVKAAADDGTGVALVLAAARWMKDVDCRDADVIFAFFDQEEIGLIGSNFFAQKLKDDGENVLAVHSYDMISFDGDEDHAIELWKPSAGLKELYESAAGSLSLPFAVPIVVSTTFGSSDHQSFLDAQFKTVGVSEEFEHGDHTPHYHTPQDVYENIQFDHLQLVSRVAFAAVSKQVAPRAP